MCKGKLLKEVKYEFENLKKKLEWCCEELEYMKEHHHNKKHDHHKHDDNEHINHDRQKIEHKLDCISWNHNDNHPHGNHHHGYHHHHCHHHHDHHHHNKDHCKCGKPKHDCRCDGLFVGKHCEVPFIVSPFSFCIDNFRLNFNGLNGNLAFQLFRFKGCRVKVVLECVGDKEEVEGRICNVGTNFVDILMDDKTVKTILIDRIRNIIWEDEHCNPCPFCHGHFDSCEPCPHCGGKEKEKEKEKKEKENEVNKIGI